MNRPTGWLAGLFGLFALSWFGAVAVPHLQIGGLGPRVDADTGTAYPVPPPGFARRGLRVYVANGCMECHTQAVRPDDLGPEMRRGWGDRSTVARDFIYAAPPQTGVARVGPDLANIATRKDPAAPERYSDAWFYRHLYDARRVMPGSIMPRYAHLFARRPIAGAGAGSPAALALGDAAPAGWEIVPTTDATALLAYLRSLDRSQPLAEANVKPEPEPGAPAGAPPATTGGAKP